MKTPTETELRECATRFERCAVHVEGILAELERCSALLANKAVPAPEVLERLERQRVEFQGFARTVRITSASLRPLT
jgi:hypothetical protein